MRKCFNWGPIDSYLIGLLVGFFKKIFWTFFHVRWKILFHAKWHEHKVSLNPQKVGMKQTFQNSKLKIPVLPQVTFGGYLWSAVTFLAILDASHYQKLQKQESPLQEAHQLQHMKYSICCPILEGRYLGQGGRYLGRGGEGTLDGGGGGGKYLGVLPLPSPILTWIGECRYIGWEGVGTLDGGIGTLDRGVGTLDGEGRYLGQGVCTLGYPLPLPHPDLDGGKVPWMGGRDPGWGSRYLGWGSRYLGQGLGTPSPLPILTWTGGIGTLDRGRYLGWGGGLGTLGYPLPLVWTN